MSRVTEIVQTEFAPHQYDTELVLHHVYACLEACKFTHKRALIHNWIPSVILFNFLWLQLTIELFLHVNLYKTSNAILSSRQTGRIINDLSESIRTVRHICLHLKVFNAFDTHFEGQGRVICFLPDPRRAKGHIWLKGQPHEFFEIKK